MDDIGSLKDLIMPSKRESINSIKSETGKINDKIENLTATVGKLANRVSVVETTCRSMVQK